MQEFELAARMDALACRRIVLGRDILAGRCASRRAGDQLADDLEAMAGEFARLWLARSRPSRLRDNLAAFRAVIAEARKLARG